MAVKSEAPVVGGLLTAERKEVVASLEEFAEEKLLKLLMPAEKCWQPQVSGPPEEPLRRASRGPHQAGPRNRGSGSGEPRTGGGGGGVRAPAPAPRAMAAGRRRSRSRRRPCQTPLRRQPQLLRRSRADGS